MPKYVKKPIPIDACLAGEDIEIATIEGVLRAKKGQHYIVTGPLGEQWPVQREIFERTYEQVPEIDNKARIPTNRGRVVDQDGSTVIGVKGR